MALRNRVTPLGELVAAPSRGLVYGNRGCLHDREGRLRRNWNGVSWISCRLSYRGWRRGPMLQPGRFTELFFIDEATALAAGHRPCALCRRDDYRRLLALTGSSNADQIDARLHAERIDPVIGTRRLHGPAGSSLPDGAFVLLADQPWLVLGEQLLRWTAAGYTDRVWAADRPGGILLTPPSLVTVLAAGWTPLVPLLHPTAAA